MTAADRQKLAETVRGALSLWLHGHPPGYGGAFYHGEVVAALAVLAQPCQCDNRVEGQPDEMVCDRCYCRHGVVWFAPSDIWNATMRGGDRANPDRYSFCCPICFMALAEEAIGPTTGWLVTPFTDGPVDTADQVVFRSAAESELAALREKLAEAERDRNFFRRDRNVTRDLLDSSLQREAALEARLEQTREALRGEIEMEDQARGFLQRALAVGFLDGQEEVIELVDSAMQDLPVSDEARALAAADAREGETA